MITSAVDSVFSRNKITSAIAASVLSTFGAGMLASPAANAALEEVMVTATKRTESSQDIAAAITPVTSEQIERTDFNNIEDLQYMAPSMQVGESFGFAQIMIRGIGTDNPFAGGDPSVAMHIDGVVTGQSSAQFGSMFDIERIEVLRGPQGTLYGRNATGGSINVITHKPTDELSGYGRLTLGNYDLIKLEGAVGGPLTDNLQARVAVRSLDRAGYGENIANGDDIDDADQQSIRGHLVWLPTENTSLRFSAEYHEEDDANYVPKFRAPSYDPAPLPALEPQPTDGVRARDPRDINSNVQLQNEREQESYSLEFTWDLGQAYTLTSLSNYQTFDKIPQADFDMTANDFYIWSESFETEQWSSELRLNFDYDRVRGLVGLYVYHDEIESDNRLDLPLVPSFVADIDPTLSGCTFDDNNSNVIIGAPEESLCFHFRGDAETDAQAIFANVSWDITETLTLNLGGRYSYEERGGLTDRWTAPGAPVLTFEDERDFSEFSPSIRLEWAASDDVLVYGGYSEGFKSGIFLSGQRSPVLDPEIVDAYEVGVKGVFLDQSLQLNAAAFYYDYTDLQQGRSVPAGSSGFTLVYENAAEAEITGFEAEMTWVPTDNLRIDGSITYLEAEFGDYISTDPFKTVFQQLGLIPPGVDLSENLNGNRMVQSPEWSGSIGVTYDFELAGTGWYGSGSVAANYRDSVYFTQFNYDALGEDSNTIVNANLYFGSPDDRWTVNVWGKNLSDEEVYVGTFILNSSRTNAGFLAPPRTYGVTLGYNF